MIIVLLIKHVLIGDLFVDEYKSWMHKKKCM